MCDLISVILPAYNAEKYLKEAIDSILGQTYKNFELIIINDGSTDTTEEIILSYDDSRIRYVKNEKNLKLIKTLNKGIDMAKGKYIARMDADDISLPNRLQVEYDFMEAHPDISVCSTLIYRLFSNGKIVKGHYYPSRLPEGCCFTAIYRTPLAHPAAFFRTEILRKYKYNDSGSALHIEAFVLWGDLAIAGEKMAVINKRLLYYRDNEQSICHSYIDSQIENHKKQVRYMLKEMLNIDVSQDIINTIYDLHFSNRISDLIRGLDLVNYSKKIYESRKKYSLLQRLDINNAAFVVKRSILKKAYVQSKGRKKIFVLFLYIMIILRLK